MRPAEEERGWVKKYGAHDVRPAKLPATGVRGGARAAPPPQPTPQRGAGAPLSGRPGLTD